jgi:tripartite-type tricarboxylate transporter receptor subunit TctC
MMGRRFLQAAALAMAAIGACPAAMAQNFPDRPIRVIVPFAGGSASDVLARLVTERLAAAIATPVVIDNRPGAGGNIGTVAAARAEPDGYTLLMNGLPLAVNKLLLKDPGFDVEKDFEPIVLYAVVPNIIVVNAKLPINSISELIDYAKARPRQLNYASVGIGSSQHLAAAYFEQVTGIQMTHVPYRITSQLVSDMISGEVQVGFQLLPNVLGMLNAGQVRPLAVTSRKRLPALPAVPTISEAGVQGYETAGWFVFLAPRGTPKPVVERLNREIATVMADPVLRSRYAELGTEPVAGSPEELRQFLVSEIAKWREVIAKAGIRIAD